MKIGISGSSGYPALPRVAAYIHELPLAEVEYIVSGGCAGPIAIEVDKATRARGIKFWCVQSNESVMFDCDRLVSFWDGHSQEAFSVIEWVSCTKPVLIIYPDGTREDVPVTHQPPPRIAPGLAAKKGRQRRVRDEGFGE